SEWVEMKLLAVRGTGPLSDGGADSRDVKRKPLLGNREDVVCRE
ncbi:hypothetical protein A2U01_0098859, partial [Trifolium medium]|nr:hypothetical protein [Trifolium medium]